MKNSFFKIMVLVIGVTVLLTASNLLAETKDSDRDFWGEDNPKTGYKRELTKERIDRIMERIAEGDPQEARRLTQLRKDNPDEFKEALRRRMRTHRKGWGEKDRGSRRGKSERFKKAGNGHKMGPRMPGRPMMPGGGGRRSGRRAEFGKHLEWLEKNYPKKAKRLAALKERDPELYRSRIAESFREYRAIREAEKDNPVLAKILKKDLELKKSRGKLLRKIRAAKGKEKDGLINELTEIVNSRYDLVVKRKQIEYERLRKKLERLQEKTRQSQANVEKWKVSQFKEKNVKDRVAELTSEAEKFKW